MLLIGRLAGLPEPIVNGVVEPLEVDCHWPGLRLVVDVDGLALLTAAGGG